MCVRLDPPSLATSIHSPLGEGTAANVLTRDADVVPVLHQGAERHGLSGRKVDLAVETLEAIRNVTLEPRVDILGGAG